MAAKKKSTPKSSPLGQGLASLLGTGQEALLRDDMAAYTSNSANDQSGAFTENASRETSADSSSPMGLTKLPADLLIQGKYQPRRQFDKAALEELSQSIQSQGLLQPIIVRPHANGGYEIVAGERRWRAALLAGLHEVPVVIKDLDDRTTLELSILENVQRLDLSALEEGQGYQRLMDEFGHRQEDLAKIMGKSRSHIANTLRLLSLPERVSKALDLGAITPGHARTLLGAVDGDALVGMIMEQRLSVRQTEELVKLQRADAEADTAAGIPLGTRPVPGARPAKPLRPSTKDADTRALEQTLESRLGLKVEIDIDPKSSGEAGKLVISYATLDQLDTVLARLR